LAGRAEKHIVDFFPFYVKDGKTLFILESKYGCKGTGFFTNVMRFLCLTPDHHFCISDGINAINGGINAELLYFFSKLHCDEESGIDMLNIMAETGKINKYLWLKKKIIYSESLINSLSEAYRKRENKPLNYDQVLAIYQLTAEEMPLTAEEIELTPAKIDKEKKRKEKKKRNPLTPLTQIQQDRFDRFWKVYPNRKSKGQAEKAFAKINPDEQLLASMIATIERAKTQDKQWLKDNGDFIPHPATWLNAKGWEDEIVVQTSGEKPWYE